MPQLVVDETSYGLEIDVNARWENPLAESIFLRGCTTLDFERANGSEWEEPAPLAVCAWEGYAVEVPAGESTVEPAVMFTTAGTYRLVGSYYMDCTPGEPLSSADCMRGPITIRSRTFVVE